MDTLAMIDAEETRLLTQLAEVRAAKAVLKRVCGLTDPPHGPTGLLPEPPPPSVPAEAPPGKPEPRPRTGESGKKPGPKTGQHTQNRCLAIARHLLAAGPQRVGALAAVGGLGSQPVINQTVRDSPWFRKAGPNLMDPWALTEAGRAAVTAAASSAS